MTAIDWFNLIFASSFLVLLNWLRIGLSALKTSIDDEIALIKADHVKEKEQTVWRVDEIYKRIDKHKTESNAGIRANNDEMHQCRKEIDTKMDKLMPESEVKDFVDRSLKPMVDDIRSTKNAVETVRQGNDKIHADISVLSTLVGQLVADKK